MSLKIDFVLTWVDGNDPNWISDREKYIVKEEGDSRSVRFRDWNNLEYWFRAIEKFTPWVNNIFFITYGHIPTWLDVNNPKLKIVKHEDFIPEKYLPTFNSHTIELNFHNIDDLSEHFVYFNDDTFITQNLPKKFFFDNGLPCDTAILSPVIGNFINSASPIIMNNMEIINTEFKKNEVIKTNFKKWVNIKYGTKLVNNLLLMPWSKFVGFDNPHLPLSYLKSTYVDLWDKYGDELDETCMHKFRNKSDVNQWVFRYWQLVSGDFFATSTNRGKCFSLTNNNKHIFSSIENKEYRMTCVNDNGIEPIEDFEKVKFQLRESFQKLLPEKSSFEK